MHDLVNAQQRDCTTSHHTQTLKCKAVHEQDALIHHGPVHVVSLDSIIVRVVDMNLVTAASISEHFVLNETERGLNLQIYRHEPDNNNCCVTVF